jgi:hypothetical protein
LVLKNPVDWKRNKLSEQFGSEATVHDGSEDDDLRLTLRFKTCCKFLTDRIKAHGRYSGNWKRNKLPELDRSRATLAVAALLMGGRGFPLVNRVSPWK